VVRLVVPNTRFWCHELNPSRDPKVDDEESIEMPLHFDALLWSPHCDPRSQSAIHLAVLKSLGINPTPAKITEEFTSRFFAEISSKPEIRRFPGPLHPQTISEG